MKSVPSRFTSEEKPVKFASKSHCPSMVLSTDTLEFTEVLMLENSE